MSEHIWFRPDKPVDEKVLAFKCCPDGIDNFCAMNALTYFSAEPEVEYNWWNGDGDDGINKRSHPIKEKNLLPTLIRNLEHVDGLLFIGDVKGGVADKYIFPHVPDKPFRAGRYKCTPTLSPYYKNRNSGNMVRHLTVICEIPARKQPVRKKKAKT